MTNDAAWLQGIKNSKAPAAKAPPLPPATKPHPAMVVLTIFAVIVAVYFYLDTKERKAAKAVAAQAVKSTRPAPRELTPAETQAIEARNQTYSKKLDADYYRHEISTGILQLNNIAERLNDLNQVAAGTARIALPQVVQQMQALRREAASVTPHQCLKPAAASMAGGIAAMVDGYLAFMQSPGDSANGAANQHFNTAKSHLLRYTKQRDTCVTW